MGTQFILSEDIYTENTSMHVSRTIYSYPIFMWLDDATLPLYIIMMLYIYVCNGLLYCSHYFELLVMLYTTSVMQKLQLNV